MTSHYHLSKISGSQQLFLTDRIICIIEQWMKSMGYGFVPAAVMYRNVIHVIFFHYLQDHVCLDPEILLPWQCDTTTSLAHTPYKESVEPKPVSHGCLSFR